MLAIADPQGVLENPLLTNDSVTGIARGTAGHRRSSRACAKGQMEWWQPLALRMREAKPAPPLVFTTDWSRPSTGKHEPLALDGLFNEDLNLIFQREYLSPRSPFRSLAIPKQGFGSWCHPKDHFHHRRLRPARRAPPPMAERLLLPNGVPIATPSAKDAPNIAIVSQWDNHPRQIRVPRQRPRRHSSTCSWPAPPTACAAASTTPKLLVTYQDGSTTRVALDNPGTWWPIQTDYFIDDYAFRRPGPLPVRVDLKSGKIRVLEEKSFLGKGGAVPGGAATVLDVRLDPAKELESLTVRAIANEVLVGLMGATLERP